MLPTATKRPSGSHQPNTCNPCLICSSNLLSSAACGCSSALEFVAKFEPKASQCNRPTISHLFNPWFAANALCHAQPTQPNEWNEISIRCQVWPAAQSSKPHLPGCHRKLNVYSEVMRIPPDSLHQWSQRFPISPGCIICNAAPLMCRLTKPQNPTHFL